MRRELIIGMIVCSATASALADTAGEPGRDTNKANPLKNTLFGLTTVQHKQMLGWLSSLPFVDAKRIDLVVRNADRGRHQLGNGVFVHQ